MSQALITVGNLTVALHSPVEARSEALECAALIARVRDAKENAAAVEAQAKIKSALKLVEDSRKAVKEPILELGRKLDATAKEFVSDLKAEDMRLATLVGNYQQLELAKLKAAEAARMESLSLIEKARQEELAAATSMDDMDAINARYNDEAAQSAAVALKLNRAEGQIVREDYEVTVTDPSMLARIHYPELCRVEPKLGAIKDALRAGRKVYGVEAKSITKAGVRLTKPEVVNI